MDRRPSLIVAVTGGAVDKGFDYNTSGMIRDALPGKIERPGKATIEILKYPHGTVCSYGSEKALIAKLWSGQRSVYEPSSSPDERIKIDLMLHMGMRYLQKNVFALETIARRDGYIHPGDDGEYLHPQGTERRGTWAGLPSVLSTGFDMYAASDRILRQVPNVQVEVSYNAGLYFCEFEFYSSLAECYKQGDLARVAFLHTPQANTPEDIKIGAKVAEVLIYTLLNSIRRSTIENL